MKESMKDFAARYEEWDDSNVFCWFEENAERFGGKTERMNWVGMGDLGRGMMSELIGEVDEYSPIGLFLDALCAQVEHNTISDIADSMGLEKDTIAEVLEAANTGGVPVEELRATDEDSKKFLKRLAKGAFSHGD